MRILLTVLVFIFAPILTEQGLQIGEININNQKIKIMKMNLNNPAFLQMAGNAGKTASLFCVTSLADNNEITFANTKLGAFADNVEYSTDNAETWNQLTADTVITLGNAETVYFRNYTKEVYSEAMGTNVLKTSDSYSIGGNITALFYPGGDLPAYAFKEAFENDTNLITASALTLPATTLAESCYNSMFSGCTGLTAAPTLPATTLAEYCYSHMFYGCTGLTEITCLATDISADDCVNDWLGDVADEGTFTKAADMEDWPTGTSGIPSGWTVQNQ